MSDKHDLLNDNDMCSFSGHEVEDMCFNSSDDAHRDYLSFKAHNKRIIVIAIIPQRDYNYRILLAKQGKPCDAKLEGL